MAKEQDQTQTDEEKSEEQLADEAAIAAAEKEEAEKTAKATKTSEAFDKRLEEDGVEGEPPPKSKDKGGDDKNSATKDDTTEEDDSEDEGDDKDSADDETEKDEKESVKDEGKTTGLKIGKELAQRGRDIGLLDEEMAAYSSEKDLEQTINIVESIAKEADEQDTGTQQPAQKTEKPSDDKKDEKAEEVFKFEFENEDDIDPDILKNLKGMQQFYEGRLKKAEDDNKVLRERIDGVLGNINQHEQTRFMGRFDGMVKDLGIEFADTFGEGATDSLSRRSNAHKNRTAVLGRMLAFAKGLSDSGQPVPEEKQLFDIAVNSLHGQKMKKASGARMKEKTDNRSKQTMGRAATRRTGSLTPQQKAVETSKKFDELIDTSDE